MTIAAYELKDCPNDAPVLLWGHANGFSAGSYLPLLQLLSKRFNIFAYDVRGQGASTSPPEPFTKTVAFDRLAHDMERVANTIQARRRQAALLRWPLLLYRDDVLPGRRLRIRPWQIVTTFDATLRPSDHQDGILDAHAQTTFDGRQSASAPAIFDSPEAYLDAMSRPHAFGFFTREMLAAHCQATLAPGAMARTVGSSAVRRDRGQHLRRRRPEPRPRQPSKTSVPAHLVGAVFLRSWRHLVGQLQEAFAEQITDSTVHKDDRLRPPHALPRTGGLR